MNLRRSVEKKAVGDVDGDALLALGGQAVDQQGEVDLLPLRAHFLAVRLERGQLVLEDHLRFVEQPPNEGGLAVIDRTAGDEAQQALVLVGLEILLDVRLDQARYVRH